MRRVPHPCALCKGGVCIACCIDPTQPVNRPYSSPPCADSSPSLYTYLITRLNTNKLGLTCRVNLIQSRSYHSTVPRSTSPSSSTTAIGVCDCICLTQ